MTLDELRNYKDENYYFDELAYQKAKAFFEVWLCHSEGEFLGKKFTLLGWQDEFIANVFGVKCKDTPRNRKENCVGLRRYRSASVWIPKGNGKTEFAAGLVLYGGTADGENGAECYMAAKSKEQANACFAKAQMFISNSPKLKPLFVESYGELVYRRKQKNTETGQELEDVNIIASVSSEGKNFHSKSPHFVVLDEIWNQTDSVLYSALSKSRRSRRQPLLITISTAGELKNEFFMSMWNMDVKHLENPNKRQSHYSVMYKADETDDWRDEATWYKANPGLGVTPKIQILRDEFEKACESPALEKDFKQFHLNMIVNSQSAWINQEKWSQGHSRVDINEFLGCECSLGLDLASTTDLAALAACFKRDNKFYLFLDYWMPSDLIPQRTFDDQVPFEKWVADGFLTPCEGSKISQQMILDKMDYYVRLFKPTVLEYDKWKAQFIAEKMKGQIPFVEEFGQNTRFYSQPCDFFEACISESRLVHFNPLLDWNARNVELFEDSNDNKRPVKPIGIRGRNMRIDGIVASVMALAPYMEGAQKEEFKSVYETRGAIII